MKFLRRFAATVIEDMGRNRIMLIPVRLAVLSAAAAWLVGCGATQLQQAIQAADPIEAECRARNASPQFDVIRTKVATENPGEIPIAKLSNTEYPTPAEQQAISAW